MMDLLRERDVTYATAETPPYRVLYELSPREAITAEAVDRVRRVKHAPQGEGNGSSG